MDLCSCLVTMASFCSGIMLEIKPNRLKTPLYQFTQDSTQRERKGEGEKEREREDRERKIESKREREGDRMGESI